jgi:hypothetical protein
MRQMLPAISSAHTGQTELAHEVQRNTDRCSGEIGDWLKMLGAN